jgi:hypothetical protein
MSESKNTPTAAPGHLCDYDLRLQSLGAKSGNPHGPTRITIRVITIRNVPSDRRIWTATIPAVICALVALGALSAFQRAPVNSTRTLSHSAPLRPSKPQPETGVGFRAASPSREAIGPSAMQFARSRRAGSPKVDRDTVGNDPFVDDRHQAPRQSGVSGQGAALKRVIVYN